MTHRMPPTRPTNDRIVTAFAAGVRAHEAAKRIRDLEAAAQNLLDQFDERGYSKIAQANVRAAMLDLAAILKGAK